MTVAIYVIGLLTGAGFVLAAVALVLIRRVHIERLNNHTQLQIHSNEIRSIRTALDTLAEEVADNRSSIRNHARSTG